MPKKGSEEVSSRLFQRRSESPKEVIEKCVTLNGREMLRNVGSPNYVEKLKYINLTASWLGYKLI